MATPSDPTFEDVRAAADRIAPHVHRTPVLHSRLLDELIGRRVHLKAEHLQRCGAFKARGATNAVLALPEDAARRGVAAHSSGNHAAALAYAAGVRGVPCHVVMPTTTPAVKQEATRAYGAEVVLCEPTLEARESVLADVLRRTGATEVHPFDDPQVIAGQGTAALELLADHPEIGLVVAPVSGGGLMAGTAIAAHGADSSVRLLGVEPANAADAERSLAAGRRLPDGNVDSIADGLLAVLSDRTFDLLAAHEVSVFSVTEEQIVDAMAFLFTRLKQVVEPSGATALAGLLLAAQRGEDLPDDVGVILSGGNVDLDRLPFTLRPAGGAS